MLPTISLTISLLTAIALPFLGLWRERLLIRDFTKRMQLVSPTTSVDKSAVDQDAKPFSGPEVQPSRIRRPDRELLAKLSGFLPPPVSS